ncbi:MAG TPA: nucleotidyl transferase AbiEii/AbiGii toxin family protein [Anaerolineaceae bacterium]|nr:nucleotidyl transferase AbiEii/AbiGii toxin family protein [Anaerolineaceae bacterium]
MIYQSGAEFRSALEDQIRVVSFETGQTQIRLRKLASIERFLAHLVTDTSYSWQLKGGFALQFRSGNRFQTPEDLDLLVFVPPQQVLRFLGQIGATDLQDWFFFEVEASGSMDNQIETGQRHFIIRTLLDGRDFETFHLNASMVENGGWPAESFQMTGVFGFAGLAAPVVPCCGLAWQAAEKFYTYIYPQDHRIFSKLEDLIDLLTIASLAEMDGAELSQAIAASFKVHKATSIPHRIPEPPTSREHAFKRKALEADLVTADLAVAYRALKGYLEPILTGSHSGKWDPIEWKWIVTQL